MRKGYPRLRFGLVYPQILGWTEHWCFVKPKLSVQCMRKGYPRLRFGLIYPQILGWTEH